MAQNAETTAHEPVETVEHAPQLLSAETAEFARPNPAFLDNMSRASSATLEARASAYGSIAPEKGTDYGTPRLSAENPERYSDEPAAAGAAATTTNANDLSEKEQVHAPPRSRTRRRAIIGVLACLGCVILVLAIILPVYFVVIRKRNPTSGHHGNSGSSGDSGPTTSAGGNSGSNPTNNAPTWGGNGSVVTKEDGTTFVYNNTFGGYWVYDPANPLNNTAKAQSWSPSLAEEWRYGVDKIYGYVLLLGTTSSSYLGQGQPWRLAEPRAVHIPSALRALFPRRNRRMDALRTYSSA